MNYISGGENLDLTGGVITVYYEDGTVDTMSLTNHKVVVSGFNNSVVGTNNLTVQYRDVTTAIAVNVVDKKISSIEISTKPIKTTYIAEKESLDLTGGIITVHYEDGTVDTMSLANESVKVSGFDNSKAGFKNVTVEYNGYKSSFDVEIIGGYKSSDSGTNIIVVIGIGVVVLIGILLGGSI